MFCVIVKVKGYMGDDTMIAGPYENKIEARKYQKIIKANLINTGVKIENISTEVKEMMKF